MTPDGATLWFLIAGAILVAMALAGSVLKRLPLTASMFYLAAGAALGPYGAALLVVDPVGRAGVLERVTEVAVLISLFVAGLKLRRPWRDGRWLLPARLASTSMAVTVGLVALVGVGWLGLPVGAAVLLGAVLAPTDPVLASDVQLENPGDDDELRFALTGEAGLNDGTAFPFVMLGLGLLGRHDLGAGAWRWVAVDVLWGVAGGVAIGVLLGTLVGRTVVHLRQEYKTSIGLDDFLALGLIALAYSVALLAHTYGFLAVFAAGLAVRRIERIASGDEGPPALLDETDAATERDRSAERESPATRPDTAPAYMARAVLSFNERLERIAEVAVVVLIGAMLPLGAMPPDAAWFVPLLFLVVRPVAVWVGLLGPRRRARRPARLQRSQRRLIAWFGIRGVGSLYYLTFAIAHGVDAELGRRLATLTLTAVAFSIVVHGVSVTPLMRLYAERVRRRAPA